MLDNTEFKVMPPKLIIWEDILYACEYQQLEYHMDFKVYAVTGIIEGELKEGRYVFGDNFTKTHVESEVFCSGFVKWDGCTNFDFDAQEECSLHTCDKEGLVNIGVMLGRVFDLADVRD